MEYVYVKFSKNTEMQRLKVQQGIMKDIEVSTKVSEVEIDQDEFENFGKYLKEFSTFFSEK